MPYSAFGHKYELGEQWLEIRQRSGGAGWAEALQGPEESPSPILGCTKHSMTSQEQEKIIPLFSALGVRLGFTTEKGCEGP